MKVREIIEDNSIWIPGGGYYGENKPKISVLMPTYSRAKSGYFEKALKSLLAQSFQRWELIIIDDCSVDGTYNIIQRYMKSDPRISCIRHKVNIGLPCISCFEAYQKARGQYITLLFDDNEWAPDALGKTYDYMVEHGEKVTYGIINLIYYAYGIKHELSFGVPSLEYDYNMLPTRNFIPAGAVVIHRDVIETVGFFDPHISITRINDWDYWNRISEHFYIKATEIFFGYEYGAMLSDSLGNSYKLDNWFAEEYRSHYRNEKLKPQNFLDYSIIWTPESFSNHFAECLQDNILHYKNKKWFNPEKMKFDRTRINPNHRRIAVIVDYLTASYQCFTRCTSRDFTFRYFKTDIPLTDFGLCDIVIVGRDFRLAQKYLEITKLLRIPVYYFLDDNYLEIRKLDSSDPVLTEICELLTPQNLKNCRGVITSCTNLTDYFRKNKLHKNIVQLGPIFDGKILQPYSEPGKEVVIAFLGGKFRAGILISCVLPAIKRLSKLYRIRFLCSDALDESVIDKFQSNRLKITYIKQMFNLEYVLKDFGRYNVNILVHCGNTDINNPYKTKNALLNAVTLGAVLVSSDIEPYCYKDIDEPESYVLTDNNVDFWYGALLELLENPVKCRELYENSLSYCKTVFNAERTWEKTQKEFLKCTGENYYKYIKQFETVGAYLIDQSRSPTNNRSFQSVRTWHPDDLCYSGDITRKRAYHFTPTVDTIREIGLIFCKRGNPQGAVTINIYRKNNKLFTAIWDMLQIIHDGYTNIRLDTPITNCINDKLTVEIIVKYQGNGGTLGVYENSKRRTFIYKVFNKLGMPLPGTNVIFIDTRS